MDKYKTYIKHNYVLYELLNEWAFFGNLKPLSTSLFERSTQWQREDNLVSRVLIKRQELYHRGGRRALATDVFGTMPVKGQGPITMLTILRERRTKPKWTLTVFALHVQISGPLNWKRQEALKKQQRTRRLKKLIIKIVSKTEV